MRPTRWFWGVVVVVGVLPVLFAATGTAAASESESTAAELIEQARLYDGMYCPREKASQQTAIGLYSKVLDATPNDRQRLHALFRMAQLHGCIFDRQKGERPDYRKAIGCYEQIVDSYPPEEPMVMTAMGLISAHYTTLREFETALKWAKKALEHDTSAAEKRIKDVAVKAKSLSNVRYPEPERMAIIEDAVRVFPLRDDLEKIKRQRIYAVDRIAQTAELIDPLRAHGELRAIAEKYAGTPVGERAVQRLRDGMDKWPDLWAPDDELPRGPASAWQAAPPVPITFRRDPGGVEEPRDAGLGTNNRLSAPEPNAAEKRRSDIPLANAPRAPPALLAILTIVGAAGIAVLAHAVFAARKKSS
ncbi:MAG: hypothetical protein JSU94_06035 [Phycisphaerales bacterium]|nr:MAG: hypothetical protein JSU94_06035 [Phycisphaerales bacterium]